MSPETRDLQSRKGARGARGAERILGVLRSNAAMRVYAVLGVLLLAFLWYNAVRRAITPGSSHYLMFIDFSRDLIFDRINLYVEYSVTNTVTKYPPFMGLIFAPLVPLPLWLGASIWFWVNLGLAVGATYFGVLTVREGSEGPGERALFVIPFVLAAGIIGSNLEVTQINHLTLFLLCWSLYAFKRGKDIGAGALIGVAVALKLTPGLFILYFLYKRSYKVVAGAAIGLVICWLVLPPFLVGFENFWPVMTGWWGILSAFLTEGTAAEGIVGFRHTNQSLSAALHRFLSEVPADGGRGAHYFVNIISLSVPFVDYVFKAAVVAILAFLLWICRTPLGDRDRLALSFEYSLIFIATLFISPISWIDHYVFLLFPYIAGVYFVRTQPAILRERRLMFYSLAASFVLVSLSASRLMQAWSLPVLGALIIAAAIAVALRGEQARLKAEPKLQPQR